MNLRCRATYSRCTQLVTKLRLKSISMSFYPYLLLDPCLQFFPGWSTLFPYDAAGVFFQKSKLICIFRFKTDSGSSPSTG